MESSIYNALKGLVNNRVFPDVAPEGTTRPYITYQQTGGEAVNFLDPTVPDKKNARVQINVWADTRIGAADLSRTVEDTMRVLPLNVTVLGAAIARYEPETKLFGSQQDFSIWF